MDTGLLTGFFGAVFFGAGFAMTFFAGFGAAFAFVTFFSEAFAPADFAGEGVFFAVINVKKGDKDRRHGGTSTEKSYRNPIRPTRTSYLIGSCTKNRGEM